VKLVSLGLPSQGGVVYGVALKVLQNPQEAEDLTQEIFLALWRNANANLNSGAFLPYLITMTRSRVIDKLRTRSRNLNLLQRFCQTFTAESSTPTPFEQASLTERSFVLNLEQQKGAIAIQNLPTPPTGRVYRLWAIVDGDKIPCGKLSANSRGKVIEQFSRPADFYDAGVSGFFVTLESSTDQRYPVGPTVIKSTVR